MNFLVCGTQKGGTSALYTYLREHPEICMAEPKEIHYFDNEENFFDGKPDYSKYHSYFSLKKTQKVIGEATPAYMYWDHAPKRIWEYNPEMKLIVLLRNPIERAYSHWNMERLKGREPLAFWDAINNEKERCQAALPYQHRLYSYIDRGFYLNQLRRLWDYFSRDRVLVLKSEDLKKDPQGTLNRVCDFLHVNLFGTVSSRNVHSGSYESPIGKKERDYLKSVFEQQIKELELVLNWDCSSWLIV